MNKWSSKYKLVFASSLFAASTSAFAAYDSGSTGADGAFNPTASQSIQVPDSGVFNYTTVNIPNGVVITYLKNTVTNAPVIIRASGAVTISGSLKVSAPAPADMMSGGVGGPGGYDGGNGGSGALAVANWVNGYANSNIGGAGRGPGGGAPASVHKPSLYYPSVSADLGTGGGGAYATAPTAAGGTCPTAPGVVYGTALLTPLIGGSGGGGGAGGPVSNGSGGGGGGGAIMIASSVSITLATTGSILANGASPRSPNPTVTTNYGEPGLHLYGAGSYGGGGSGGAIYLVAPTVSGDGTLNAAGAGATPVNNSNYISNYSYGICATNNSMNGGDGRIRVEADTVSRTVPTYPTWSKGPLPVAAPVVPTLSITNIGGVVVPAGNSRIALANGYTNPLTVQFATTGVPDGSTIRLTVIGEKGLATSVDSAGTVSGAASAQVSITGPCTMQAAVTYNVAIAMGDALSVYAQGERVKNVTLASALGSKESKVTLTTISGKEYVVPASVLAAIPS